MSLTPKLVRIRSATGRAVVHRNRRPRGGRGTSSDLSKLHCEGF